LNLEKQVSAHKFSFETDRHPPGIHLFGGHLIYRSVLYQTSGNAPGDKYFTPMDI
jgi:hypothetical protein